MWLTNISAPFKFAATFLVTYYWNMALSRWNLSKSALSYINKMKIPYIIAIIVIFGLEIASIIARLYLNDPIMQLLDGIVVIAVSNIVAIFFFFVGIKVLVIAYKARHTNFKSGYIIKVSVYIMTSGLCYVGYSIATLLIITPPGWQKPEIALTWWFLFSFFLTSISLLQILAFTTKVKENSSDNNRKLILMNNKVAPEEQSSKNIESVTTTSSSSAIS